jgi:hypothetical protein
MKNLLILIAFVFVVFFVVNNFPAINSKMGLGIIARLNISDNFAASSRLIFGKFTEGSMASFPLVALSPKNFCSWQQD